MKGTFATGFALLAGALISAGLFAQSGASTSGGVYTSSQADQGHALYSKQCAECHGEGLEGSDQTPALTGQDFLTNWTGQTLGDFFTRIQNTMPASAPGSLKPEEVTQLIAYILQQNKYPAGKTDLPITPKELQTIHIDNPPPGGSGQ